MSRNRAGSRDQGPGNRKAGTKGRRDRGTKGPFGFAQGRLRETRSALALLPEVPEDPEHYENGRAEGKDNCDFFGRDCEHVQLQVGAEKARKAPVGGWVQEKSCCIRQAQLRSKAFLKGTGIVASALETL